MPLLVQYDFQLCESFLQRVDKLLGLLGIVKLIPIIGESVGAYIIYCFFVEDFLKDFAYLILLIDF